MTDDPQGLMGDMLDFEYWSISPYDLPDRMRDSINMYCQKGGNKYPQELPLCDHVVDKYYKEYVQPSTWKKLRDYFPYQDFKKDMLGELGDNSEDETSATSAGLVSEETMQRAYTRLWKHRRPKEPSMAALATGVIDPTKVGKYRVVLSDALLGKDPKEVYTGVRYNHKPTLSSTTAPHQARIKPNGSSDPSASYDLSFQDEGGRYAFQGSRGHEDNQYVLIFDPEREVFVLHRVDSMFNMNSIHHSKLIVRQEQPSQPTKLCLLKSAKPTKSKKPAPKDPKPPVAKKADPPAPVKPAKSKKAHHDSEDESSDDDLLTIEDPGGAPPASNRDFSPGFIDQPRRFSDFVQQYQNEEEEEEEDDGGLEIEVEALNDADGEEEEGEEEEEEDDEPENFTLPSPIHRQMMGQNINSNSGGHNNNISVPAQNTAPVERESDEDEEEMEDVDGGASVAQDDMAFDDLEAELMRELEKEESDVSEEE
ncbi:hypothetical protein NPX13_g9046 [Xylaria arbuscula]|uniref:Transcription elongation factor Eaf N-terminal domain-containing protein n=1 Tax=Xylaria arbuscula TaxID=114810 RepID=A0A9W8N7Q8_9PEZI|nr:hypothetical protein NPX13_g9046 [Xylaria arbuscula]